ncbi:UbiA-like polyprenyltransferase [Lignipirellula cremea]|uniref:4-hydroxybenzoate polyprenyltransferase n=1 Tax=Lignipirellula cremea TaxID=2528010 RepID=A0A518DRH0_9BACT|nr:UbiA-like polyprenyltransferase [Lignipirellula cremea]QDU94422.1 4-hydroxybenzoate octaprenyltransferase [Lignipirellula cremea]
MFEQFRRLLEMIRFSHTIFALPFAMLAAVMAWTAPGGHGFRWLDLLGVLVCMVGARSAAMAFNRLVDRKLDAGNPRTAQRHLPAGLLSVAGVTLFTVASTVLFYAGTLLFLPNLLPLLLATPVLAFLLAYSYTKRFTALAHFWLGASLMLAPVSAWIAIRGEQVMADPLDLTPAILLGLAVLLWVAGFDIIYACQDADYDSQVKLHSVPAWLGTTGALRLAAVCHAAMIAALAALPFSAYLGGPPLQFGWLYALGAVSVALLLAYEHWLVKPNDLTRVNIAFFQVNAVVSIGLFLVGTLDLLVLPH